MSLKINIEDGMINYQVFESYKRGNKEDILLIHGSGMDSRYWYKIIPLLQSHFRVITYDLRGHGDSKIHTTNVTWELLMNDLFRIIDVLQLSQFHVVGHGLGANLAIQFIYHHPGLFKTLTMISSTVYYPPKGTMEVITYRKQMVNQDSLTTLADYLIPKILMNTTNNPDVDLLYSSYSKVSAELYFNYLQDITGNLPDFEQVSKITLPTLILTGEFDPIYPPRLAALSAFAIPNNHHVVISNSSNATFLDQPEATVKSIMKFIFEEIPKAKKFDPYTDDFLEQIGIHINQFIQDGASEVINNEAKIDFFQVELLHSFVVRYNGKDITKGWNQRFAKPIFCYLIFHRSVTREQICDDLFPELDIKTAKRNLRVYMHHLKRLINQDSKEYLSTDKAHVYLTGNMDCDLINYIYELQDIEDKDVETYCQDYMRVISRAPKVIMPGIFDDWASKLTSGIHSRIIKISKRVSSYHSDHNEFQNAIECLEYIMDLDHVEDELFKQLI